MPIEYQKPMVEPARYPISHAFVLIAGIGLILAQYFWGIEEFWYTYIIGVLMILFGLFSLVRNLKTKKEPFWKIYNPVTGAIALLVLLFIFWFFTENIFVTIIVAIIFAVAYYKSFFMKKDPHITL